MGSPMTLPRTILQVTSIQAQSIGPSDTSSRILTFFWTLERIVNIIVDIIRCSQVLPIQIDPSSSISNTLNDKYLLTVNYKWSLSNKTVTVKSRWVKPFLKPLSLKGFLLISLNNFLSSPQKSHPTNEGFVGVPLQMDGPFIILELAVGPCLVSYVGKSNTIWCLSTISIATINIRNTKGR